MGSVHTSALHATRPLLRGLTLKHIIDTTQVKNPSVVCAVVSATHQSGMKHNTSVELIRKEQLVSLVILQYNQNCDLLLLFNTMLTNV